MTDVHRVADWVEVVGNVDELKYLSKYRARLTDRLGPFRLAADLDVEVVEADAERLIRFVADGEDRQVASRILIEAQLGLAAGESGTTVSVEGKYEVTGRVATLGASMIKSKGEKILDQFFTAAENEFG